VFTESVHLTEDYITRVYAGKQLKSGVYVGGSAHVTPAQAALIGVNVAAWNYPRASLMINIPALIAIALAYWVMWTPDGVENGGADFLIIIVWMIVFFIPLVSLSYWLFRPRPTKV